MQGSCFKIKKKVRDFMNKLLTILICLVAALVFTSLISYLILSSCQKGELDCFEFASVCLKKTESLEIKIADRFNVRKSKVVEKTYIDEASLNLTKSQILSEISLAEKSKEIYEPSWFYWMVVGECYINFNLNHEKERIEFKYRDKGKLNKIAYSESLYDSFEKEKWFVKSKERYKQRFKLLPIPLPKFPEPNSS